MYVFFNLHHSKLTKQDVTINNSGMQLFIAVIA